MHKKLRALAQYDPADKWGDAMMLHFAIASVLTAAGDSVPAEWEYRPGLSLRGVDSVEVMFGDDDCAFGFATGQVARLYMAGDVTADDLVSAGNVLARYIGLLERAGLSY